LTLLKKHFPLLRKRMKPKSSKQGKNLPKLIHKPVTSINLIKKLKVTKRNYLMMMMIINRMYLKKKPTRKMVTLWKSDQLNLSNHCLKLDTRNIIVINNLIKLKMEMQRMKLNLKMRVLQTCIR